MLLYYILHLLYDNSFNPTTIFVYKLLITKSVISFYFGVKFFHPLHNFQHIARQYIKILKDIQLFFVLAVTLLISTKLQPYLWT